MRNEIIDTGKSQGKNEKFFSIAILILIIIAIGGFAILRGNSPFDVSYLRGELSAETNQSIESPFDQTNKNDQVESSEKINENSENQKDSDTNVDISSPIYTGESYVLYADYGDGLTHIARKALKGYLSETNQTLTVEQKVYAEDYIQKKIDHSTRWLQPGEEIEVDHSLILDAINQANTLNQNQLQNLTQYTANLNL